MKDKEVIINGVDVSGCEFLCNRDCWCEQHKILVGTNKLQKGDGLITCKDKTNCYYKQLQRKEQACNNLQERLKRKEQEYKNLVREIRTTDEYSGVCRGCQDDILLYPTISNRTSYTDNEVYLMALQKIIDALENKKCEC